MAVEVAGGMATQIGDRRDAGGREGWREREEERERERRGRRRG